jgi:hypothetical protein
MPIWQKKTPKSSCYVTLGKILAPSPFCKIPLFRTTWGAMDFNAIGFPPGYAIFWGFDPD